MLIIKLKQGESLDKGLKRLKRKFEKIGIVKELREREKFTKPSVKKREEKLNAVYIQKKKEAEEDN